MDSLHQDRRDFLKSSLLAGAAMTLASGTSHSAEAAATGPAIRLGGPIFTSSQDPAELARAHRLLGYRAAYCPSVKIGETARLKSIREAFQKENVVIAEVGRWVNLLDADPAKRKTNLELVSEGLAIAEAVGARCCVDIAGSFSKTEWFGPHPENLSPRFFDAAVENARKIIDSVKPKMAKFSYEMMGWAIPDSADSYLRLIKAIDRPGFAVHLDPCNAINSPARFYDNTGLLNECYDKLGRWIVSAHAKDLKWLVEMNVHFKEVIPGTGALDYATFLKRHAALPGHVPMMIEHLANAAEYDQARGFIIETGKKGGITFS
jgi:sugar phosphate isomerase/epimerase